MKVLLSSIGSRGDVQPLLALALELRALGHEASLCVPPNFRDWVETFGLRCTPIGPDVKQFVAKAGAAGKKGKPSFKRMRQLAVDSVREQFQVVPEAARGCDVIVAATALQIAARSAAETLGIPYVFVGFCPAVFPAPDYPPLPKRGLIYPQWLPPIVNRALWRIDERLFNAMFLSILNDERGRIGLRPVGSAQRHIFGDRPWLAADPALAPVSSRPDLPIVQTGGWLLSDPTPLPEDLEQFLANGEPPVYFGFGSMRADGKTGGVLVEAARAAGVRAVLSQGWGNIRLAGERDDCISIGDVNHEKLFARVAAVVHHGGSGTTTTAAKSGKPQVIVPHSYDQYYFASRVQKLGAGVACLGREELTVDALGSALRQCLRPEMRARAESLAGRIALDGAKVAARRLTSDFARTGLATTD